MRPSTPPTRTASPPSTSASATSARTRPRLAQRRFSPVSASTKMRSSVLRRAVGRLAHARRSRRGAVPRAGNPAARRADQLSRPRRRHVARKLPALLSAHRRHRQPRPRPAQPRGDGHPASRSRQAESLYRRLRRLRGGAAREAAPGAETEEEAGRGPPPHPGVHRPLQGQGVEGAQAQSRVKALAKMQPIAAQLDERVVPFHLPQPRRCWRAR